MSAYLGVKIPSFYEQLYDRYHIEDVDSNEFINEIALGKLIRNEEYDLNVWNMHYDTEETYASIDVAGNAGVEVTDNNTDTDIPSLEYGNFTLDISQDGKFLINNSIEWQFGDTDDPILEITGYRGIIFAYMPESQINESLKFGTDLIESYDGTEQRIVIRYSPEQEYSFKYYLRVSDYDAFEQIFLKQQTKFYMPIWTMNTRTELDLPQVGDTENVTCDTIGRGMAVGDNIIIWDAKDNYEVVTISGITDTDIDFTETLTGTYSKPYIMPIKQVFVSTPNKTLFANHKKGFFEFTYKVVEPKEIDTYSATYSLNSIPIILDCNYFEDSSQGNSFENGNQYIDFNTGIISVKPFWDYPKEIKSFGWYKNSFADIYKLYELLNYLKGRQKIMYMPTFQSNFVVSSDYSSADTYIDVVNNDQDELFNANRRNAIIFWVSGTPYYKEITSITENPDSSLRINIESAFGVNMSLGSIGCWLVPYRLDSDSINIKWDYTGQIYVKTTIREVDNL